MICTTLSSPDDMAIRAVGQVLFPDHCIVDAVPPLRAGMLPGTLVDVTFHEPGVAHSKAVAR